MLQPAPFVITFRLRQVLVDQLPHLLPHRRSIHPEHMVPLSDELLADHIDRPIAADSGAFVQNLFDEAAVCQHDRGRRAEFEGEDTAVGLGPLCESKVIVSLTKD